MKSVVFLGSGKGSTIDYFCEQNNLKPQFQIRALITENKSSGLSKIAKKWGTEFFFIPYENPESFDERLVETLKEHSPDLIVLAGFLKKIGMKTLERFEGKIINSHPSLLPLFSGKSMYGRRVHEACLKSGNKSSGVSIHMVSKNYDEGEILGQKEIDISKIKTVDELEDKVKEIEKPFYLEQILKFLKL